MNIVVYCGSSSGNNPQFAESARTLGKWIGENGHTLVYGGAGKGLMGEISTAALQAGGKVIGVLPDVPMIQARRQQGLTEYIETRTMSERKSRMIELADAFVALPGGIGTIDEITEVMALSSLDITPCPIVLFDTDGYYKPFKEVIENIIENGLGRREFFSQMLVSENMDEIAAFLTRK